MKLATGVLFLLAVLLASPGCRQHRYFVDLDRAAWSTEAGKKADELSQRDLAAKQRQASEAFAAAKKAEDAKEADAPAKLAQANQLGQRLQGEFNQARNAERQRLVAGLGPALARVAADRHIEVIELAPTVAFFDPGADVTADVIARANDIDRASEVSRLKAENEALKAKGKP